MVKKGSLSTILKKLGKKCPMRTPFSWKSVLKKRIYVQAENWFKQSAKKEEFPTERPLIGLLRVKIANNDMDSAESYFLQLRKSILMHYPNFLKTMIYLILLFVEE